MIIMVIIISLLIVIVIMVKLKIKYLCSKYGNYDDSRYYLLIIK